MLAMRRARQSFPSYRHELHDLFGLGDAVVAAVRFHATAPRRGAGKLEVIEDEEAHTWTFRDGKVIRFEWGRDLKTALEAAGLSE